MLRKLPFALLAVAALIAGVVLLRIRLDGGGDTPSAAASATRSASSVATSGASIDQLEPSVPSARVPTEAQIKLWSAKAAADPRDAISRTYLGNAYLDLARDTGDFAAYDEAQKALEEALAIDRTYTTARTSLAALRYTTHDFAGAGQLASEVVAADPSALSAKAIVADADLELGRYDDARRLYDELAAKAPGPAIWARQARLALVDGHADQALDLARRAAAQGDLRDDTTPAARARSHVQAATYALQDGDHDAAAKEIALARAQAPDSFLAAATAGRLAAVEGRWADAIAAYQQAVAAVPEPTWLAALGDLYSVTGQPRSAEEQYEAVDGIARLGERQGVLYNRQLVLFLADHDRDPQRAYTLARSEADVRQDVFGWDALAWAALKGGRLDEARAAADKALSRGTKDPALLYHAGMVAAAAGDEAKARTLLGEALTIDPNFDPVQAPLARSALQAAGGRAPAPTVKAGAK